MTWLLGIIGGLAIAYLSSVLNNRYLRRVIIELESTLKMMRKRNEPKRRGRPPKARVPKTRD